MNTLLKIERAKNSIFFKPVRAHEVISIAKSLKSTKTCGYDDINSFTLKQIIYYIADPICHIFNLSMSLGCYPNDFKLARVVPIFKKGNRIQCENYRPISILPCLSKILERIIHNQVYNFLDKNKLIRPAQYGFRRQHSTELAVLDLYDRITKYLAKKTIYNWNIFRSFKSVRYARSLNSHL